MKRIILLSLVLTSVIMLPVQAWQETDENNMSGPVVRVTNKYAGAWKGWSDGCVNCYKPLASDHVSRVKKTKKIAKNKTKVKPIPKSLRRGYCECSCDKPNCNAKSVENVKTPDSTELDTQDKSVKDKLAPVDRSKTQKEMEIKPYNMDVRDKSKPTRDNDKSKLKQKEEQNGATTGKSKLDLFSLWKS